MAGRLFVISSPSGGGKTTVVEALCKRLPDLKRSVSVTTRQAREGEVDGRDYRFVSREIFKQLIEREALLEWAEVHGQFYGTPKEPVEEAILKGERMVLCIDVQGARSVRNKLGPTAELIFLKPPSLEALQERLIRRDTESEEALQRRLAAAREELAQAAWYDHEVVNDQLEEAVSRVEAIIQTSPNPAAPAD